MTIRMIGHDEHYGRIGMGGVTQSAANAFSSAPLPAIIEPDLIISTGKDRSKLNIKIDDVLVWDCRRWDATTDGRPDTSGGENGIHELFAGITHDNVADLTAGGGPTAFTVAEGVFPGGQAASVTGSAGLGTTIMAGDEVPRFEANFEFMAFANEENAVGEINQKYTKEATFKYEQYDVEGIAVHKLLTAAHYWFWVESTLLASAAAVQLGADVRRMSVDVQELMFDREVLLSILDALVLTN